MRRTPTFWLNVSLFVLATSLVVFVVVAIKNGKTSHDGWSWSLEFVAGLLANVVAALIFLVWFESEAEKKQHELLGKLRQPGSRVISKRDRLQRDTYEKHFDSSDEVEILGIACKSVLRGIFPDYEHEGTQFDISKCRGSKLYQRLKDDKRLFTAKVYFLNSKAPYARDRNAEHDNNRTLSDLNAIVAALKRIVGAHQNRKAPGPKRDEPWHLAGTLSFHVYRSHPGNSVFRARKHEHGQDVLFVGYLFSDVDGASCPTVEFVPDNEEKEVFDQCDKHLRAIQSRSKPLFTWGKDGPRMEDEGIRDIESDAAS